AANAAAMLFDQLFERDAHLFFKGGGIVDVTGDAEQLGTGVVFAPEPREPRCPAPQDFRNDGDGFHVVDRGGATIKPHARRERWLQAWLAFLALQRLEQ